ncbi:MAG: N-acetyl-alpha-D-glucosaminyl L-malate synthase BshA [Myxococcales bacterium]|nr:N-acetyl-alpha-D-glucosaminyl L-malate synthase BshA [Myxococcales bacterium]MCB9643895.1 N-acetyl-alpha-D-glucosaminyl L-malate synthase BshA [Myxococcales bacterium]
MTPTKLRIGIVCYPNFGGSGIVATEIGLGLAQRGHEVHLITTELPVRARQSTLPIHFHRVEVQDYPLFEFPPYTLALASRLAEIAQQTQLDILHLHYAIPHAVSGYLARQILQGKGPRIIVTLHGTDVTRVGCLDSYRSVTRMALLASDGITAPSHYLRKVSYPLLDLPDELPIEVISNFVDTQRFHPAAQRSRARLDTLFPKTPDLHGTPILAHLSNFRPIKRIPDVIDIFARVNNALPARLLLIGEGPERRAAAERIQELGLQDQVCFLGKREDVVQYLQHCDLMLMPSETESFGLAALESMSCGVPVIASDVGGLHELIEHQTSGFLAPVYDTETMAKFAIQLLQDPQGLEQMMRAARKRALDFGDQDAIFDQYERFYQQTLTQTPSSYPCQTCEENAHHRTQEPTRHDPATHSLSAPPSSAAN